MSNILIRRTTLAQISSTVRRRILHIFVHAARASENENHLRDLCAAMNKPRRDWRRPRGRARTPWTRVMTKDLAEIDFGLLAMWRKARTAYTGHIDDTATLSEFTTRQRDHRRTGNILSKSKSIKLVVIVLHFITVMTSLCCDFLVIVSYKASPEEIRQRRPRPNNRILGSC